MAENTLLTVKQRAAVDALLAHGDQRQAARAAGVNDRTLRRWMHDPLFAAALQEAQDTALDQVTGDLVRAASGAVALLAATVDLSLIHISEPTRPY